MMLAMWTTPVQAQNNQDIKLLTVDIISTERVNAWSTPWIKVKYEICDESGSYHVKQMTVEGNAPWEEAQEMVLLIESHTYYEHGKRCESYDIINAYPVK